MFVELFCEQSETDKADTICFSHWPFIFLMLFECLKNTETFKNVSVFLYMCIFIHVGLKFSRYSSGVW